MGLFPEEDQNSHYFSRHDENETLGSAAMQPFSLDDQDWPSVEHYFQALSYEGHPKLLQKILASPTAKSAAAATKWQFWKKRKDWKKVCTVIMTRAVYTRCKTYPEVAQALLETGEVRLVENSNYDYFWGCGRDRRGENAYGKVLMNVREKLKQEAEPTT